MKKHALYCNYITLYMWWCELRICSPTLINQCYRGNVFSNDNCALRKIKWKARLLSNCTFAQPGWHDLSVCILRRPISAEQAVITLYLPVTLLFVQSSQKLEPRSGPTECRAWSGSKLFDFLIALIPKVYLETVNFEDNQRKLIKENFPACKEWRNDQTQYW